MAKYAKGTVYVSGLNDLLDRLDSLKNPTETRAALRSGIRAGATVILKRAKALAPVDTGRLRKSLKVKAIKRSRRFPGRVGYVIGTSSSDRLFVGDQFYAGMIEYGTSKMAPNSFLRPAFDFSKEAAIKAVRERVSREVIKRMARKK